MRFVFKTGYDQDIRFFKHAGYWQSYGFLFVAAVTAPLYLGNFEISELTQAISFAIAGLGLMLLVGFTGQVSLGHAAFFGIGAYAQAWLLASFEISFLVAMPIAAVFTGIIGFLLAIPLLRMTGIYLAIGTLAPVHRAGADPEILENRYRRVRRQGGGAGVPARLRVQPGQLGFLLCRAGDPDPGAGAVRQPASQPDRPGHGRGARFRGLGAQHGRQHRPDQDHRLRYQHGDHRPGRRPVRPQAAISGARRLQPDHFDHLPADDRRRRARLAAGRHPRRARRHPAAPRRSRS